MDKTLVSVIIPTHSGYENLNRAVDSVLNQTYPNVEILVVDDNGEGTENQLKTAEKMQKYADVGNVKYLVHKVNKNGSAARNTGINASSGDYIAFLDDDDEYLPDNIEKHVEAFQKLPEDYGITYCGKKVITTDTKAQVFIPQYEGDILLPFLLSKFRIGSSFIMLKRETVLAVNGFDESFRRHQDWEFIARVLDEYKCGKVESLGLIKYNLGRNSARSPEKFEEFRMYYLEKIEYIFEKFTEEERIKIYDNHYSQIGKEYFKAKKLKKAIYWAKKTSHPVKCFISYGTDGMRYIKRKIFG